MSNNISSLMGLPRRSVVRESSELVDSHRNVGVEIEVEMVHPNIVEEQTRQHWEVVEDGSLRPSDRSAELIFPTPGYAGQDIIAALNCLRESSELKEGRYGWRTAAHVHVDMRDKNLSDIHNIITAYALLEPYIFAWEGSGRQESRFCMPWWVCSQDMIGATSIVASESSRVHHLRDRVMGFSKYTALNLAPLRTLGTIEFRHMQSTIQRDRLLAYINLCLDIVSISERVQGMTPIDLVEQYTAVGSSEFIRAWLSANSADMLLSARATSPTLSPAVLTSSVSTALTLAELQSCAKLEAAPVNNIGALISIMRGE